MGTASIILLAWVVSSGHQLSAPVIDLEVNRHWVRFDKLLHGTIC